MATEHRQDSDMRKRIAVIEVVQEESEKRMNRFDARMDRLEAKVDRVDTKVDRILFAVLGATVVILGAMTAGFIAILAN